MVFGNKRSFEKILKSPPPVREPKWTFLYEGRSVQVHGAWQIEGALHAFRENEEAKAITYPEHKLYPTKPTPERIRLHLQEWGRKFLHLIEEASKPEPFVFDEQFKFA